MLGFILLVCVHALSDFFLQHGDVINGRAGGGYILRHCVRYSVLFLGAGLAVWLIMGYDVTLFPIFYLGAAITHAIIDWLAIPVANRLFLINPRFGLSAMLMDQVVHILILYALFEAELCVCDISQLVGVSQTAISHQLRILKNAKLVKFRREGKTVFYSLADDHVRRIIDQGMEHILE